MKVRIATRGIKGNTTAISKADAEYAILVPWVEIDGERLANVVSVTVRSTGDGAQKVTLELAAIAEFVLVDHDWNELPDTHVEA